MLQQSLTDATTHLRASLLEANRALLTASGLSTAKRDDDESTRSVSDATQEPTGIEPAADLPGWDVAVDTGESDAVSVGTTIQFSKTITDEDVARFAVATGDTNPIHLDDDAASDTRFGDRIAHGILVSGLISAALARLPGSIVYLSQDLEFHSPVYVGDDVTADCTVVESLGNDQYRLSTVVRNDETTVIDGEAVILIDGAGDA